MLDEDTVKRRRAWALVLSASSSRHTYEWLLFTQNMATVIEGLEAARQFLGGVFKVVTPDNMATVVTKAHAFDPLWNHGHCETPKLAAWWLTQPGYVPHRTKAPSSGRCSSCRPRWPRATTSATSSRPTPPPRCDAGPGRAQN